MCCDNKLLPNAANLQQVIDDFSLCVGSQAHWHTLCGPRSKIQQSVLSRRLAGQRFFQDIKQTSDFYNLHFPARQCIGTQRSWHGGVSGSWDTWLHTSQVAWAAVVNNLHQWTRQSSPSKHGSITTTDGTAWDEQTSQRISRLYRYVMTSKEYLSDSEILFTYFELAFLHRIH